MTDDEKKQEIMDNFDFHRARKMMEAVNWRWYGNVSPTIEQLRALAESHIDRLINNKYLLVSSGGLTAIRHNYRDDPLETCEISLFFGIDWLAGDQE